MKKHLLLVIGLTIWLSACEEPEITIQTPAEKEQVSEILLDAPLNKANTREGNALVYFTMGYNNQISLVSRRGGNVESLRIAFTGIEDSRCPINARCLTQGYAKVQIAYTEMGQFSRTVPMCIGDCGELDRSFDNEARLRLDDQMVFKLNNISYALVLTNVIPDLIAGIPTLETDYAVEMQVKAL